MTEFLTADPLKFEQALLVFTSARAAFENCTAPGNSPESEVLLTRFVEAEDDLLALTAPDIDGVIEKLLVIWADELSVETPTSVPMMRVIGDLRRLAALGA